MIWHHPHDSCEKMNPGISRLMRPVFTGIPHGNELGNIFVTRKVLEERSTGAGGERTPYPPGIYPAKWPAARKAIAIARQFTLPLRLGIRASTTKMTASRRRRLRLSCLLCVLWLCSSTEEDSEPRPLLLKYANQSVVHCRDDCREPHD